MHIPKQIELAIKSWNRNLNMPPCKLGGYTIAALRRDTFGFVKNQNEFDGFCFPEDMLLSYVLSGRSLSAMFILFRHLLLLWAYKILFQILWHRWNEDATHMYMYLPAVDRRIRICLLFIILSLIPVCAASVYVWACDNCMLFEFRVLLRKFVRQLYNWCN